MRILFHIYTILIECPKELGTWIASDVLIMARPTRSVRRSESPVRSSKRRTAASRVANPTPSLARTVHHQTREQARQDPYRSQTKPGVARCPACSAVNYRGKWLSLEQAQDRLPEIPPESKNHGVMCPACRQSKDRYAMGVVELHGDKWRQKSSLVFQTIGRTEAIERSRNDQERVLWSRTFRGITKIYVSLPELARHIGRQLKRSFKGAVEYHRSSEEPYLRVVWHSDAKD